MAKKKVIENLSAEELYALAEQRQQEEEDAQREAVRGQLDELKATRRDMVATHKKELAAIDKRIKKLGGQSRTRSRSSGSVTDMVLKIVAKAGQISTKEIKAKLEAQGIVASNLSQTLAYLKRQGRVASPERSVYTIA